MNTDDYLRPLPDDYANLLQGFGQNILARGRLKHEEVDYNYITRALQQGLEKAGPLGMLSVIRALVISGLFTREMLLRQVGGICGEALAELFEELLDEFEGPDPLRDCWTVRSDGYYIVNVTY